MLALTPLHGITPQLYVLQNQPVHDGATWNSSVNHDQLRDGRAILAALVPAVIEIMTASPVFDDDPIDYPVIPGLPVASKATQHTTRGIRQSARLPAHAHDQPLGKPCRMSTNSHTKARLYNFTT